MVSESFPRRMCFELASQGSGPTSTSVQNDISASTHLAVYIAWTTFL